MSNWGTQTKARMESTTAINDLHNKTFGNWANNVVKTRGLKVENLVKDVSSGVVLINLIEILTKKTAPRKWNANPNTEIQKMDNCSLVIDMVKEILPNLRIDSKDIVNGEVKPILGMIWQLILQFQNVLKQEGDDEGGAAKAMRKAKERLLQWLKDTLVNYPNLNLTTDFKETFKNGMGFCALVHAFNNDIIAYNHLDPNFHDKNLELAFQLAEQNMGIPRMFDPKDLEEADDKVIMTYLYEYPRAFLNKMNQPQQNNQQEEERRKLEEQRRLQMQEEENRRLNEENMRRQQEEELRRRQEEELRRQQEEQLRRQQEEQLRRQQEEQLRRQQEEEQRRLYEENLRRQQQYNQPPVNVNLQYGEDPNKVRMMQEEIERLRRELDQLKLQKKEGTIGRLAVTVVEARGLSSSNKLDLTGKLDPYAIVQLERQKEVSEKVKNSHNPRWNASYNFYVSEPYATLDVTIFDKGKLLSDTFLGKVEIPVSSMEDKRESVSWYPLQGLYQGKNVTGEVFIKIFYSRDA
eukprot:TRINITY_DN548_c0_g1_i1.p1 TRINITY_DN548_c0_g1~~TRINITY_DN548_c0_g1_i1.p1  ORF type:complete len:521 (-),score=205.08 TRINITY_DN548_c0_g1_i1:49-1611(-)